MTMDINKILEITPDRAYPVSSVTNQAARVNIPDLLVAAGKFLQGAIERHVVVGPKLGVFLAS